MDGHGNAFTLPEPSPGLCLTLACLAIGTRSYGVKHIAGRQMEAYIKMLWRYRERGERIGAPLTNGVETKADLHPPVRQVPGNAGSTHRAAFVVSALAYTLEASYGNTT